MINVIIRERRMSKDGDFPMSSHAPLFLPENPHSQFPSRLRWSNLF